MATERSQPSLAEPHSSGIHGQELTLSTILERAIVLAEKLGLSPDDFFLAIGYKADRLQGPTSRVPIHILSRFLTWAAMASDDPSFGLKVGSQIRPHDFGAYGYLLLNSRTLGEGMELAGRFADFSQQGGALTWITSPDSYFEIRYDAHGLKEHYRRQDAECTLAIILAILQNLTGRKFHPVEVRVQHEPSEHGTRLENHFGCYISYFDRDNALRFDTSILTLPIRGHDPQLLSILIHSIEQELKALPPPNDELGRVRWAIRRGLSTGRMNMASVSRLCQSNERTLQRRLSRYGTSFSETVDQVRQEVLAELDAKGNLTQREIVEQLGFCDASAFAKARKRWSGKWTPQ